MDLIGVNRSYKVAHADVWCTVDSDAWRRAFRYFKPTRPRPSVLYLRKTALDGFRYNVPSNVVIVKDFLGNSGLFGIHIAKLLGYEEINLLGFDVHTVDHFEGPGHPGNSWQREMTRMTLWKMRDDGRLRLWNGSGFVPLVEAITWDEKGRWLRTI